MTNRFTSYPSIDNERNWIKSLNRRIPEDCTSITLTGSVKIHGTNAGIGFWKDGSVTAQSRNRILSVGNDNFGFAGFVTGVITDDVRDRMLKFMDDYSGFGDDDVYDGVIVYGEWCGGNIQKGVAVTGMDRKFVIFDVAFVKLGEDSSVNELHFETGTHEVTEILGEIEQIYNVYNFQIYQIEDINPWKKQEFVDAIDAMTLAVEEACPVGTTLNDDRENDIGEGIVWEVFDAKTGEYYGQFKSKGDKHKRTGEKSKVKTAITDDIRANPMAVSFLEDAVTEDRLMQGIEYLNEMGFPLEPKSTGEYLKWVNKDIEKEFELDIAQLNIEHGIDWKYLVKIISHRAREFFFAQM